MKLYQSQKEGTRQIQVNEYFTEISTRNVVWHVKCYYHRRGRMAVRGRGTETWGSK